jgi:hypothetical protein
MTERMEGTEMSDIEAIRQRALTFPGVDADSPMRTFIDALDAWDGRGLPPVVPDDTNLWRWFDRAAKDRADLLDLAARETARADAWKADAKALAALLRRMQAESIFTGYWRELADELVAAHEARVKEEDTDA